MGQINFDELAGKLTAAVSSLVAKDEAEYFATELVETYLRKGNRLNPLKSGIADIEACLDNQSQGLRFIVDVPAYFNIDFNGHGPLVYIKQIHDELEKRARKCGLAMAAFTNSKSMHTLHSWVQGLTKRGLVAIASSNGGPAAVIPHNGTKGVFGTNPIAYGIPGEDGEIHCVDMATSEAPYFEILNAEASGEEMRPGIAVDQKGQPTTDPNAALDYSLSKTDPISNLVPMGGGYKGYNLVYLLEILTSGLIGAKSSPEMSADFVAEEHGSILIVFDPQVMNPIGTLSESVTAIHQTLKKQTPRAGEEIRIPGSGNTKRYKTLKDQPIEVDETLLERLNKLIK